MLWWSLRLSFGPCGLLRALGWLLRGPWLAGARRWPLTCWPGSCLLLPPLLLHEGEKCHPTPPSAGRATSARQASLQLLSQPWACLSPWVVQPDSLYSSSSSGRRPEGPPHPGPLGALQGASRRGTGACPGDGFTPAAVGGSPRCPTRLRSARCSFSFSFRPSSRENSTIGRWEEKQPVLGPEADAKGHPDFCPPAQGVASLLFPAWILPWGGQRPTGPGPSSLASLRKRPILSLGMARWAREPQRGRGGGFMGPRQKPALQCCRWVSGEAELSRGLPLTGQGRYSPSGLRRAGGCC